jgi:uroporphyrinogen decarboxylase
MIQRIDRPDFERFRTTIRGGHADRVPVAEALIDNKIKAAVLGRPILSLADDVAFWENAGYDFICLPSGILDPGQTLSAERLLGTREDQYDQGDKEESEIKWATESTGQIRSMEDLESYPWPTMEKMVPAHLTEVAQYLPDGMKAVVTTGKVFTAAWQLMGFEAFCFAVYDNPELVETLFDRIIRLQVTAYERICEMDIVGGFWFSDDVAYTEGMMISPKILRRYLFPVYKKMIEMAHQVDKIAIYHSDGRIWDVLDDIIDCGFDAFHPIEPKAMDITEVRQRSHGKLSLIGNIDINYPLATGTPEAVRAQVRERIAALAPAGGYIVGSSNSIPPWIPIDNYISMIQANFDLGRYPITLD